MQTSAYGFNISIENIAHLLKNSDVTLAEKFGLINSVFISYTSRSYSNSAQALARQLREIPMFVEIWNEETAVGDTLFVSCLIILTYKHILGILSGQIYQFYCCAR
jgi:histidyl-tRNA synthetase